MLVNPSHAAAWHAWGMLEKREGNFAAAKDLWIKVWPSSLDMLDLYIALIGIQAFIENEHAYASFTFQKIFMLQGVKKTRGPPNPHLYQSLAVLAGEMGFVDEARAWFRKGTESVRVS